MSHGRGHTGTSLGSDDEAEDLWRRILSSSDDAFVGIDEDSTITDWNPSAEDLFGWPAGEAVGRGLADTIIPPAFAARHHAGMRQFLHEGSDAVLFRPLEVPALHRSGRLIPVELRIWPAQVEGEWRFYAFLRDRSEQERIQAHMRLIEEVTDAANAAMEAREAVEFALERLCAVTGWPVGHAYLVSGDAPSRLEPSGWWHLDLELDHFAAATADRTFDPGVGLPGQVLATALPQWVDLVSADNFPRASAAIADGLHSGFAFPVLTGTSVAAVLEFYTSESVDADPDLLDLVQQIGTQLGRVFERQRVIEELAEASELRSRMMSMLSHDVGNPLAVIRGYARALDEDVDHAAPADLRRFTDGIVRMADRLDGLMSSLLTGLRAESGRFEGHPERLPLRDLVDQALLDLHLEGVAVEVAPHLTVHADRGHVLQILENLLTNATKYGAPPVEVHGAAHGDRVVVTVTDHGHGLPSALTHELFTPFARGPAADETTGTGLGLWICRHLARQNGGDVTHQPVEDAGARFLLDLPTGPAGGPHGRSDGHRAAGAR